MGRRAAVAALAVAVAGLAGATALSWDRGGGEAPPQAAAAAPAALDGAALFQAKGCAVCHLGPGLTEGFGIGPDLRGLAGRGARPENVRRSILAPGAAVVPGFGPMPSVPVTRAEADALVGYLLDRGVPRREERHAE